MKKALSYFSFLMLLYMAGGCKKENEYPSDKSATVLVFNGAINAPISLKTNGRPNNSLASTNAGAVNSINFGTSAFMYAEGNSTTIDVVNHSTKVNLFTATYDLKKGSIYSLFTAGQVPNVEGILVEEDNFPFTSLSTIPNVTDSIVNIRFVNLSPDTQPLDVRIQGASTNETSGLAYKGYTAFKSYPAKITAYAGGGTVGYTTLNFEFRENGSVLRTYQLFVYFPNRFKNVALVMTGLKSNGSLSVKEMNYFQNN